MEQSNQSDLSEEIFKGKKFMDKRFGVNYYIFLRKIQLISKRIISIPTTNLLFLVCKVSLAQGVIASANVKMELIVITSLGLVCALLDGEDTIAACHVLLVVTETVAEKDARASMASVIM